MTPLDHPTPKRPVRRTVAWIGARARALRHMPMQTPGFEQRGAQVAVSAALACVSLAAIVACLSSASDLRTWAIAVFFLLVSADDWLPVNNESGLVVDSREAFVLIAIVSLAPAELAIVLAAHAAATMLLHTKSLFGLLSPLANMVPTFVGALAALAAMSAVSSGPIAVVVAVVAATLGMRIGELVLFVDFVLLEGIGGWIDFVRAAVLGTDRRFEAAAHVATAAPVAIAWSSAPWVIAFAIVPFVIVWRSARNAQRLVEAERRIGIDPLTGLANRERFAAHIDVLLATARDRGDELALVMGDLDNFKRVNDVHGHLAGDEVLRRCAAVLTELTERHSGLFASRYGGEEFLVVAAGHDRAEVLTIAEQLRSEVYEALHGDFGTSISVGVAYHQVTDRAESLVDRADKALYAAKFAGKNRVHDWPRGGSQAMPVTLDDIDDRAA